MFKKLLIVSALALWAQLGVAATEINIANKAALQSIKDVGPQTADAIVAERTKGGNFKNWDDLVKRVKGIGSNNSVEMSQAGLTVNGQAKPNTPAKVATVKSNTPSKTADKSVAKATGKPMSVTKDISATKDAKSAKVTKPATDTHATADSKKADGKKAVAKS